MSRTAVITGASSGVGAAIAERLLARGEHVIAVSRRPPSFADGDRAVHVPCDLADLDALPETLGAVARRHPTIDTLISNAGAPIFGNLEELAVKDIRRGIDVNLTSHVLVARAFVPVLKTHPRSELIFVGSEASLRGGPRGSIYCASKFGLRGFAQSLRLEGAASGMRVCLLLPGMMRTGFFDTTFFEPGDDPENAISLDDVASSVEMVLDAAPGTAFEEIVIQPLKKVVKRKD